MADVRPWDVGVRGLIRFEENGSSVLRIVDLQENSSPGI